LRALHAIEEVVEILRTTSGDTSPLVANWQCNLAVLVLDDGDVERAIALLEIALENFRRTLGESSPSVARTLKHLSAAERRAGSLDRAFAHAIDSERSALAIFRDVAPALPERQALLYSGAGISGLDEALVALASTSDPSTTQLEQAWDALIRRRAVALEEMARRSRLSRELPPPQLRQLWHAQTAARRRLAERLVQGPAEDAPEAQRRLEQARKDKETAERSLLQALNELEIAVDRPAFDAHARVDIGLAEVRAALPSGAALVAYARYWHDGWNLPAPSERSYLAFVATDQGVVTAVDLGAASTIDSLVARWRDEIEQGPRRSGRSARGANEAYRAVAAALRERIWDPVANLTTAASSVYFVPDGTLHLLNPAALPSGAGYLLESGPTFHLLDAERDLLLTEKASAVGTGALVCGDVDYDAAMPATAVETGDVLASRSPCSALAELRFERLPHSQNEAADIARQLARTFSETAVESLSGAEANEAKVAAAMAGKRLVHLATHAYALRFGCHRSEPAPRTSGLGASLRPLTELEAGVSLAAMENPLLLSGLALAGANARSKRADGMGDGILTAEEVACLDLRGVEWVVLSACDTGLGVEVGREGVISLRRAFELAGARSVIMSLWQVEDRAAREWMSGLYKARFSLGLSTSAAVRAAALEALRARRERGESDHPAYWAAFVATGDWR
jgi:CHAT domain-containing protein